MKLSVSCTKDNTQPNIYSHLYLSFHTPFLFHDETKIGEPRVNGGLNLTRSIGDFVYKREHGIHFD